MLIWWLPDAGPTDEWNDPRMRNTAWFHQSKPPMKYLPSDRTESSMAPIHTHTCENLPAVVKECQFNFAFVPIQLQINICTVNFLTKFTESENSLRSLFEANAAMSVN